jgi:hypothetical protein
MFSSFHVSSIGIHRFLPRMQADRFHNSSLSCRINPQKLNHYGLMKLKSNAAIQRALQSQYSAKYYIC